MTAVMTMSAAGPDPARGSGPRRRLQRWLQRWRERWRDGQQGWRQAWWLVPAVAIMIGTLGTNRDVATVADRDLVTLRAAAGALPATAALLVALWAPRIAVMLNGIAVGAYFAAGLADGPIFVSVPLAAYVAARWARPRVLLPWLGAGTGVVVIGLLVRSVRGGADGWVTFWPGIGVGTAALTAALLGWRASGRREVRAERARRAVVEEQLQMAQDLHDGVGHGLALIAMQAGVALRLLDRVHDRTSVQDFGEVSGEVRRSLQLIRAASVESLDALRAELARMAPEPPGRPRARPQARTPQRGFGDLPGLLERVRSGGTQVELVCRPDDLILVGGGDGSGVRPVTDPAVAATAYAIVQESLTNMLRHAAATRAVVEFRLDGSSLVVTVVDDGTGSAGTGSGNGDLGGQGITGMRARAQRLGGSLQAGPADGGGWRVRAVLPIPSAELEGDPAGEPARRSGPDTQHGASEVEAGTR